MKTLTAILSFTLAAVTTLLPTLHAAEPIYEGLGSYQRPVTTTSADAQKYFNQGLGFLHGFNHGAAIRSFQEAARLDPGCAMAHWGIAYACGPHINFPLVPPPAAELAWKELALAKGHAAKATPVERDLIEALAQRYANPQPEDRSGLDRAYADAMRQLWANYPQDPDVGSLFAEAMLDLRPWDQWTPDGKPQPGTEEVVATLNAVLALSPNHPLANHLYIHTIEASPHPERADAAADRLRQLQPGLAHNVHMPSHIDIRRGRWQQAIDANEKAIEADRKYRQIVGPPKGLINFYAAHNQHMLAFAAMMTGQRELALKHIRDMVQTLPADFVQEFAPVAEPLAAMPDEVMVRFGMWDEILAQPAIDPKDQPFTGTFRHAARAIAHSAKGDSAAARSEQKAYLDAMARVPKETMIGNNNPASVVFAVITPMLEGEILVSENKIDEGIAQLRQAIAAEDQLRYEEPPGWLIPVRHSLGAVLMRQGRLADAEQVYRQDLKRLPNNGWSLYGLAQSLRQLNKPDEAADIDARFKDVWARADLQIQSSCLCQPGR